MASFQIRQRDPLLDQNTQAMLERRGRELMGLGLIALALLFTLMLWTYSPEDPGWMVATQEPARNMLGRFGAAISSTLVILIGRGAWSIPLILLAWGLRFMLHHGAERVLGRIVFAVIAVALAAAYSSTLVAPEGWPHTFGLGGLFGDTVAGALIGMIPGSAGFGLKLLSLVTFFALLAMLLFVTGFDRAELRFIRQVLVYGSIMAYSTVMQALGKGASGALSGAMDRGRDLAERRRTARNEAAAEAAMAPVAAPRGAAPQAMPQYATQPLSAGRTSVVRRAPPSAMTEEMPVGRGQSAYAPEPLGAEPAWNAPSTLRAEPRHFEAPAELPKEKMGFLARMKNVVKPDPEWVEQELPEWAETDQPSEDRIKARISDVIRSRAGSGAPVGAAARSAMTPIQAAIAARRAEPPVMRARGPKPLIADTRPGTRPPTMPTMAPVLPAAWETAAMAVDDSYAAAPGLHMAPTGFTDDMAAPVAEAAVIAAPRLEAAYGERSLPDAPPQGIFTAEDAGWLRQEDSFDESWSTAHEQLYGQDQGYGDQRDEEWASDWQPDSRYEPDYDPTPVVTHSTAPVKGAPTLGPAPSRIGGYAAPAETYRADTPYEAGRFAADDHDEDAFEAADVDADYVEAPRPALSRGDLSRVEIPRVAPPPIPVHAPPAHLAPVNAAVLDRRPIVQPNTVKPLQPSTRAREEAEPRMRFEEAAAPVYELPPLSLLASASTVQRNPLSDEALEENARMLESVLDDYGVKGEIVSVRPGPVVTMYELEPAPGLKASRVIGLADDIARSMSALSARVSTVPGRTVIGIELPNAHREKVVLREIIAARAFGDGQQTLPLALGKDIGGEAVVANLAKMPHLLIAGTTGSGKSVAINTMILSLLYKLTPEECRLIMIDPKMLELSVYDGIPHLLSPVVTDPKKAVVALKWVVGEMEERYRKMSKMGVRNIEGYNARVREALDKGEMFKRTIQTGFDDETGDPVFETDEFAPQSFPYIVVVVDEMADLMMVAGKEIEACIQRLAQMARASGIHLIMATQRPSVDVITGTIKANFPTRISFQVTSKIDSRTILGEMGAEQLLGQGDMLYMGNGARITRIHGPFVSDEEVEEIVNHLKSFGPPTYMSGVVEGPDEENASEIDQVLGLGGNTDGEDALYDQAVAIVAKDRKCSTSYIQRKLGIGYNKAARLVEQMEENSVVTPANHVGKREILIPET